MSGQATVVPDAAEVAEVIDADLIGLEEVAETPRAKKQRSGEATPEKERALKSLPQDQQGLGRLFSGLSNKLDSIVNSMHGKIDDLSREGVKLQKGADRRHDNQVYEKAIDEVKQHGCKHDARLDDLEVETHTSSNNNWEAAVEWGRPEAQPRRVRQEETRAAAKSSAASWACWLGRRSGRFRARFTT